MEVYNFRCKNCGSTKYNRVSDSVFECPYCGYREEIISPEPAKEPDNEQEDIEVFAEEPEIEISEVRTEEKTEKRRTDETKSKYLSELKTAILKFILVVFFGELGIQHFIEGRVLLGFIYVCTFGFFFFGWFIDTILYLVRLLSAISNYLGAINDR